MAVMKATDFVTKAKAAAKNYKTLYIMGCFGAPMNSTNKTRYCNNHSYNKQAARTKKIKAASADTFGFDCVCLLKGLLWGWSGNKNATYGGAKYASNGVPDKSANGFFDSCCTDKSTNFKKIVPGEFVWMSGHIGVYIGDGLAVECTPIWKDGVQITAVGNIGKKSGYNTRTWTKHGKCKFLSYTTTPAPAPKPTPAPAPKPSTELKVGDTVTITGYGNASSYGDSRRAAGIGWTKKILKIWKTRKFPYQVGDNSGTTGFYKADALKKK